MKLDNLWRCSKKSLSLVIGAFLLIVLLTWFLWLKSGPIMAGRHAIQEHSDLIRVKMGIEDYVRDFHKLPSTQSRQIALSVLGDNSSHKDYIDPSMFKMNANGQLLNRNGDPLVFEFSQGTLSITTNGHGASVTVSSDQ